MQISQSSGVVLPADWTTILTRMQQEIDRSIASVTEREEEIRPSAQASAGLAALEQRLSSIQEKFQDMDRLVSQAGQQVTQADHALRDNEECLRSWLRAIVETRERLTKWASRAL